MRKIHVLLDAAKSVSRKLAPHWEGPYEIIEAKSPLVYILSHGDGKSRRLTKAHVNELKRWIPPRAVKRIG